MQDNPKITKVNKAQEQHKNGIVEQNERGEGNKRNVLRPESRITRRSDIKES